MGYETQLLGGCLPPFSRWLVKGFLGHHLPGWYTSWESKGTPPQCRAPQEVKVHNPLVRPAISWGSVAWGGGDMNLFPD